MTHHKNKLTTVLSSLAIAALGGLLFASCTNSTSPSTTAGVPTNLKATSKANNVIGVEWTRDANDTSADTVMVTNSSTGAVTASPTSNSATSMDLTENEGIVYSISVHSTGGASSSIQWMTATRTSGIRLWDITDLNAGEYSALQLNDAAGSATALSFTGSNLANTVDFVLDTTFNDPTNPSGIVFESADVWDPSYRATRMDSTTYWVSGGLDNFYLGTDLSTAVSSSHAVGNAYYIPSGSQTGSKVIIAITPGGHVAKIAIDQQPDGSLFGTSGGHKFIDVDVSYQPVANEPYAARPHRVGSNGRVPRIPVY